MSTATTTKATKDLDELSLEAPRAEHLASVLVGQERPPKPSALSASVTFGWRAMLKIKHVPEQLFDVTMFPVMFTLMFTYVFGGAIAGSPREYLQYALPGILVQHLAERDVLLDVLLVRVAAHEGRLLLHGRPPRVFRVPPRRPRRGGGGGAVDAARRHDGVARDAHRLVHGQGRVVVDVPLLGRPRHDLDGAARRPLRTEKHVGLAVGRGSAAERGVGAAVSVRQKSSGGGDGGVVAVGGSSEDGDGFVVG